MPDLAIYFDRRGGKGTYSIANRFLSILGIPDSDFYCTAKFVDTNIAAVNILKPFSFLIDQPIYGKHAWLMLDGLVYPQRSVNDAMKATTAHWLKCIITDIVSNDMKQVEELNGQFNIIVYIPEKKRLVVITDRLGSRPLYYGTSGAGHIVSSEIKTILSVHGDNFFLSPLGLMEFFAFGHNLVDRTIIEGITVLPPGAVVTIDDKGFRCTRYFKYRYQADERITDASEAGVRISECVRDAVVRCMRGNSRKGIFLSGGLDSRIIASSIVDYHLPVHAFTFGYPESRDIRYAAIISSILGFKHHLLMFPHTYLSKVIRQIVERTECATPFHHTISPLFHNEIATVADEILVGFCGDVFSGGHLRHTMFNTKPGPELVGIILNRALCADRRAIAEIIQPAVVKKYWPLFLEAFRSTVTAIKDQSGPDTADVWDVENRQRRFTFSAPKVDRHRFEILAPFLDNQVTDLMRSIPASFRRNQIAYKHAIVSTFPHMRDVPWTTTGRSVSVNPIKNRFHDFCCFIERAFGFVMTKIDPNRIPLGRQFRNVDTEMKRDQSLYTDHLIPFLNSDCFPQDILNREGILNLVNDHVSGRRNMTHLISCILTLGVFWNLKDKWKKPIDNS